ncbi:hypothetical protein BVC80_277g34 [Macleaya cordata]|uniref:Uncharacterized protein n=1 Tax=Macleaya cordata TaxID=56857 RepID=A0A200Q176_MACCD|nr:hypothetical protein BVC80_277g34 [Macleaya cordata]
MSVAGDSPLHSSSSDDFTALLDAELEAISSASSSDQEEEEVEEEDVDLETERGINH